MKSIACLSLCALGLLSLSLAAQETSEVTPREATKEQAAKDLPTSPPEAEEGQGQYVVLPIAGVIGQESTAALMALHLENARRSKAKVVVLEIDTPGGYALEAEEMVNLIINTKDLRFVALVRRALSAGAVVAMACETVIVTPEATIGAAMPYGIDKEGVPKVLEEKFHSVWRAVGRKAAENGGHPPVIPDAMIDPGFALTMQKVDSRIMLERDGSGEVIKAKESILTLTAREAVAIGLAKAVVDGHEDVGEVAGLPGWKQVGQDYLTPVIAALQKAQEALDTGDNEAASQILSDLTDKNKHDCAILLHIAEMRIDMQQHLLAVRVLEDAIRLKPGNAQAHVLMAKALCAVGRHAEAIRCCNRALEADPKSFEAYMQLGEAHAVKRRGRSGSINEELAAYNAASGLRPYSAEPHWKTARMRLRVFGWEDLGLQAAEKAVHLDPTCAEAHYWHGIGQERGGNPQKAFASYALAYQLDLNGVGQRVMDHFYRAGRFDEMLALDRNNALAYCGKSLAALAQDDPGLATRFYGEAVRRGLAKDLAAELGEKIRQNRERKRR